MARGVPVRYAFTIWYLPMEHYVLHRYGSARNDFRYVLTRPVQFATMLCWKETVRFGMARRGAIWYGAIQN